MKKTIEKKGAVIVTAGELPLHNRKIESEKPEGRGGYKISRPIGSGQRRGSATHKIAKSKGEYNPLIIERSLQL